MTHPFVPPTFFRVWRKKKKKKSDRSVGIKETATIKHLSTEEEEEKKTKTETKTETETEKTLGSVPPWRALHSSPLRCSAVGAPPTSV